MHITNNALLGVILLIHIGCFTPSDFNVSECTGGGNGDDVGSGSDMNGNLCQNA